MELERTDDRVATGDGSETGSSRVTADPPAQGGRSDATAQAAADWSPGRTDGPAIVFEGCGAAAEGVASEAQVDLLYRQIGQLKVENDFLARNPRT